MTNRLRDAARWGALALFLASPGWAHALTERLLDCEQQAKRLAGCCGTEPRPPVVCKEPGCGGSVDTRTPEAEIRCLEELSCEEIRDRGLCLAPGNCRASGAVAVRESAP